MVTDSPRGSAMSAVSKLAYFARRVKLADVVLAARPTVLLPTQAVIQKDAQEVAHDWAEKHLTRAQRHEIELAEKQQQQEEAAAEAARVEAEAKRVAKEAYRKKRAAEISDAKDKIIQAKVAYMADQLSAYRAAVAKSHQLKLKQEKTAYVAEAEWWKKKSSNGRKAMTKLLQYEGVEVDSDRVSSSMERWRSSGSSLRKKLSVIRMDKDVWQLPEDSSYRPLSPVRPAGAFSSRPGTSHSMSKILANQSMAPAHSHSPSREYSYDHEQPWAETARWLSSSGFKTSDHSAGNTEYSRTRSLAVHAQSSPILSPTAHSRPSSPWSRNFS